MKRIMLISLMVCLLLSGCGWMDGSHVTVTDHREQSPGSQSSALAASDGEELRAVLRQLVESGTESGIIDVAEYDPDKLERGIENAAEDICTKFPLGAYAIDTLTYEIGDGGGHPAISVDISYIHGRSEIRQIREAADMEAAWEIITEVLDSCAEGVVLLVDNYEQTDLQQMTEDFAAENPHIVMETPQTAVGVYPEKGASRILELKFTYQTSRDVLRQMQSQVERVFSSAAYYIDSDSGEMQKYTQLYTFLMERADYTIETSITPSYSLLIHGVGDSKAVATAYAAMCRQVGLECQVVSGTRAGEPWYWNLIRCEGEYFHADLLKCDEQDVFECLTDDQMQGYVWDYSAYPVA